MFFSLLTMCFLGELYVCNPLLLSFFLYISSLCSANGEDILYETATNYVPVCTLLSMILVFQSFSVAGKKEENILRAIFNLLLLNRISCEALSGKFLYSSVEQQCLAYISMQCY